MVFRFRHSQSLLRRRHRFSQAVVRSTVRGTAPNALGQHHEPARVTAPHDLDVHLSAGTGQALLELRPLVARVGVELQQEGIQPKQRRHHQDPAIAILDIGGMHDGVHQQALRVDQDVPLLPLDLLAAIEARRIDAAPPFSALLTLWLSMMAAVGLASRSACSRHSTSSAWCNRSSVPSSCQRQK